VERAGQSYPIRPGEHFVVALPDVIVYPTGIVSGFPVTRIASGGIFLLAIGGFAIWYGLKRDIRPKGYKEPATFRVTSNTIEAGGRTFKTEDIHRLLIRNGITDQEIPFDGIREVSAAQASGMAYRARVGQIANGLTLETGGKSTLLAGGMDGTTAYGLLTDVSKAIGFKTA
jgi:hypothetical protein